MPKAEKVQKVAELKQRIEGSQALFLADFRGLTVADVTDLRRSMTDAGTRLAVVKNTLMKRAVGEAGAPELEQMLEGPTAVAFVDGDPIAAAKGLVDAIRRFRTLALKGGYMEGRLLSAEQAQALATIEPREVLLAKLAGMAKAEMATALYMFQALQSRFLALLEAYREKVPGEATTDAAEASADAERQPGETAPEESPSEGSPAEDDGAAPEEQEEQPTAEPPAREEASAPADGEDEEGKE